MRAFLAPVVLAPGGSLLCFEWKICPHSSSAEKANIPALLSRQRDPSAVKTRVNTPALLSRQREPLAVKTRVNTPALLSRQRDPSAVKTRVNTPALLSCQRDPLVVKMRVNMPALLSRQRDPSAVKTRVNTSALLSRQRTPIALAMTVCTATLFLCGAHSAAEEGRRRLALACSRLWKKRRGMDVSCGLLHQSLVLSYKMCQRLCKKNRFATPRCYYFAQLSLGFTSQYWFGAKCFVSHIRTYSCHHCGNLHVCTGPSHTGCCWIL